jgi:hypothetical protein
VPMANQSKDQPNQPTKEEEGPRSFAVFLRQLANGEAESVLSYEQHELLKILKDESEHRHGKVKGSLTVKLHFTAEEGIVDVRYETKSAPPKRSTSTGRFWLTEGANLSPKPTKQTEFPFGHQQGERAPREPQNDEQPPREA